MNLKAAEQAKKTYKILAIKKQPSLQQPLLVILTSVDDVSSERILLDPNQLDPSSGTAIDFFVASLDGSKVAISISKGGRRSAPAIFASMTYL